MAVQTSNNPGGCGCGSESGTTIDQNNRHKFRSFLLTGNDTAILTNAQVAAIMNNNTTIFGEIDVPYITIVRVGSAGSISHNYYWLAGKGTYGIGGTTVTVSMLKYDKTNNSNPAEIENGSNTQTINLGTVTDYIAALNSVGRNFTNTNLQYFVKYSIGSTSYYKIFIGTTYGMYGGTNTLQFTDEMWQDVVTSTVPGAAGFRVTISECITDGVLQSGDLIGANTVYMAISQANAGVVSGTHTLNPATGEVSNSEFYAGGLYQITFK